MLNCKHLQKSLGKITLFVILVLYLPFKSSAWGMLGHRIVGQIASTYLTAKAQKEIKSILGNESIAMASNWADFIKSDSNFQYLSVWHYIDFDSGFSYNQLKTFLQNDTAADAYTKLDFMVKQLKNKSLAPDKKLMYLRLVIHIAGDIHQPFHVSETGDEGGNLLRVSWFGASSNIHRVWDDQLIGNQQLSYTEYAAAINYSTLTQRKQWQKQPLSMWLFESYTISQQLRKDLRQTDLKLGYQYNFKNVNTLNEQLLKGGIRLAGLLNDIFG